MTSMDNRERNALARGTEGDRCPEPRMGLDDLDARCARIKAPVLSLVLARESAEARVVAADLQRELDDVRAQLWKTGDVLGLQGRCGWLGALAPNTSVRAAAFPTQTGRTITTGLIRQSARPTET